MSLRLPSQQHALPRRHGTRAPRVRTAGMRAVPCNALVATLLFAPVLALAVAACSGGSPASPVAVSAASSGGADPPDAGTDPDGGDPFASCPSSAPASGTIPAEVEAVLKDRCQTCHTNPPVMGAPISLLTFSDIHALFAGFLPTYQEMHMLIQADGDPHMPFLGAPQLSAEQFSTLDGWLKACAPSGN